MAKITYELTDKDNIHICRECTKIEFTIPEDLDVYEIARVLKMLLYSIGYAEQSIDAVLRVNGVESTGGDDELFNDMFPRLKK